jgi:hypothetical protein
MVYTDNRFLLVYTAPAVNCAGNLRDQAAGSSRISRLLKILVNFHAFPEVTHSPPYVCRFPSETERLSGDFQSDSTGQISGLKPCCHIGDLGLIYLDVLALVQIMIIFKTSHQQTKFLNLNLVRKVTAYVETYMNTFDGSHDYNHIKHVLGQSRPILKIQISSKKHGSADAGSNYGPTVVTLTTLLHDVGDRKYLTEGENGKIIGADLLLFFSAERSLAEKVQTICLEYHIPRESITWNMLSD